MAQHDYNIEDQNGFDFLVDLNNVLSAIATNNAGSPEPNPTFPHMLWFDTNNLLMKVRNASNSAWDIVAAKDSVGWTPARQGTALGTASVQPDNRYVHRSNNLSDLPNLETARATLGLVIGTDIPPKASPTFTGVPTAPTAAAATNTTQIATTAYTRTAIPNVFNASGVAPMFACRAWINFNGTGGTVILANGNVSSIADHAVGDYTINFTIKMLEANYCITGSTQRGTSGGAGDFGVRNNSITRESVGVVTADGTGVLEDASTVSVAIFR